MNAFTHKPDIRLFVKQARARQLGAEAATKRVMASSAQHLQTKNADFRKAQIHLKGKA